MTPFLAGAKLPLVPARSAAARDAFHYQEIAFSICMGAVAILGRDNPAYSSPGILWAFALLLAFNLGYQIVLRRKGELWVVPMVSMAVNTVLVTLVLSFSGGENSGFWPMYLLPIFTACLYLQSRQVVMAAAFSIAFLGCLHLDAADGESASFTAAEFLIKAAVLSLSAGVTSQFARRERCVRDALEAARAELDRLAAAAERSEAEHKERGGLSKFMEGIIYDVQARLAVILGGAELLRKELGEGAALAGDAERIETSARALQSLVADILRLTRGSALDPRGKK